MFNGCNKVFQEKDIQKFTSKDIFSKYERFKINVKVESDENLKWCSRPGCQHYVEMKRT